MKKKLQYVRKSEVEKMSIKDYMIEQSSNKDVKIIETELPIAKNYILSDLSLNQRGGDEDKAYAFNEKLRFNIRRGNSVIFKVDDTNTPTDYFWGRRGLQKFFDLQREYIEYNLSEIHELTQFGIKNGAEHKELFNIIFKEVQDAFIVEDHVSIFKLVKANGENAQVSYFKELDAWVISSKNVALVARNRADIDLYAKDRFNFAKLIGQAWFNQLDRISKTEGSLDTLKAELNNRTMVGEYCGNQEYQHLVKYENIDILFYAIVDNQSNDSCIPPLQAYDIFKKYNFSTVNLTNEGSYSTLNTFSQKLKQIFDDVASSDIEGEQEGSVLYFVRKTKSIPQQERVLSLSKLKTLEYRIFRKLREKLKNYSQRKDARLKNKYEEETKQLCLNNAPAKPLEFYFKIGELSFDFIDKYPASAGLVAEQYISFLSVIIYCMEKGEKPHPDYFMKDRLQKLLEVPWSSYTSCQVKNDGSKIQIETVLDKKNISVNAHERNLFVIIPISVPGMGKSTFTKYLSDFVKANNDEIFIVSSDEIRRNLMNNLKRNKPFLNDDQLFDQTQKQSGKEFFSILEDSISKKPLSTKAKNVFVFIDKNHPPNAIDRTVSTIIEKKPKNMNLQICALITSETEPNKYRIGGNIGFPFSQNFFLNCISRVQNRTDHPTLKGNGGKSLDIMMMFTNLFRNVSLSDGSLKASGIDLVLRFPFIKEDSKKVFPSEIVERFEDAILQTVPGQTCKNFALIQSLSDKIKNNNLQFENISFDEIKLQAQNIYNQCINSLSSEKKIENDISCKQQEMEQEEAKQSDVTNQNQMEIHDSGKIVQLVPRLQNKRKVNQKFNPPKQPLYLGIFANEEGLVKKTQINYVKNNLQTLFSLYKEKIIQENSNGLLDRVFKYPQSHHITTYFVKRPEGIFYENFEEGLDIPIQVLGMAYVPNKIICGVCLPDPNVIEIENKVPHMTLFVDEWAPKFSNNVLQALFTDKDAPLSKEFESGDLLNLEKQIVGKYKLPIQEQPGLHDVYFIKPSNNIMSFEATTKAFFGNGPQQNNKKQYNNNNNKRR